MKVPPEQAGNYNCPLSMAGVIKTCQGKECMAWIPTQEWLTLKKIDPAPEGSGWEKYGYYDTPEDQTYRRPVGHCGMPRWIG